MLISKEWLNGDAESMFSILLRMCWYIQFMGQYDSQSIGISKYIQVVNLICVINVVFNVYLENKVDFLMYS